MSEHTPYERHDDRLNADVLWDSSHDMPDMKGVEFDRRAERLPGFYPAKVREHVRARLADAGRVGDDQHPYDAAILHVWELYRIEATGHDAHIPGLDAWVSDDGLANTIVEGESDLSRVASMAAKAGWPVVRVWMRGEEDPIPYRFLLLRTRA